MSPLILIIILLIIAALYYQYQKIKYPGDIVVPPVPKNLKRMDLFYGYYGCLDEQVAETKDHINMFMESQFNGMDKAIQNILAAKFPTMLDISYQVFYKDHNSNFTISPLAETQLRQFFTNLDQVGALRYIKWLYPTDEPNNTVKDPEVLSKAISLIKKVASEYPVLAGVKLAVIYAMGKPFICQELYDVIAFNDYDKKSSVLTGQYQVLKKSLLSNQQTMLIPGGAYGQDPTPFLNFAEANPEVSIVMPFLWLDDNGNSVGGPGIRSIPAMKAAYIAAGKSIIYQ